MKSSCLSRRFVRDSFTLVELLVAMTVLSLMILMFFQMVSMISNSTGESFRRSDSIGEARMALDRFGVDWSARGRRSDLAPIFTNSAAANNYCDIAMFYSQVDGFGSGTLRPMSQVAYYVTNSPSYSLSRWANGTTWTATTPLQFNSVFPSTFPPNSNYQSLADDICRLQFYFQLKSTGQLVSTPPAGFTNVNAVVVAIAALDKVTRKRVSAAQVAALSTTLGDATISGTTTPQDQWSANLAAASGTLPTQITQNVRICQRTFYTY